MKCSCRCFRKQGSIYNKTLGVNQIAQAKFVWNVSVENPFTLNICKTIEQNSSVGIWCSHLKKQRGKVYYLTILTFPGRLHFNHNINQKAELPAEFGRITSPPLKTVIFQSVSHVQLFGTQWIVAYQISLSFTISWSLVKLISIESVMPSNHLILCHPLLLLLSIFLSIRVSSNKSALLIRWPK